ncbi:hypothetical protein JST97_09340 [bacterium]|nr:hypothetical protein [bacterium]
MRQPARSELAQKAHQLNNLLSVIQGYADLLLLDLDPNDDRAELLREILRASDQASQLTASLPRCSREVNPLPEAC